MTTATRLSWTNYLTSSNQLHAGDNAGDMDKLAKANDNTPVYQLKDDLVYHRRVLSVDYS